MSGIAPANRVYIDQAGVENTLSYAWGWSAKGERCLAERLGHKTERISMEAAWCCGRVFAPHTFSGTCNSAVVEAWFEQTLLPSLRAGQTVILDNAAFHRESVLRELLAQVDCFLLFLPPYSPDLNKIEPQWQRLKTRIGLDSHSYPCFHDKVDAAFTNLNV